jgi:hypothetical protein
MHWNPMEDRLMAPMIAYPAAILAIMLLLAAIFLIRRRRSSRGAGIIFLVLSAILHVALLIALPMITGPGGGGVDVEQPQSDRGKIEVAFSSIDEVAEFEEDSETDSALADLALPLNALGDLVAKEPESEDLTTEVEIPEPIASIPEVPTAIAKVRDFKAPSLDAIDAWIDELAPATTDDSDSESGVRQEIVLNVPIPIEQPTAEQTPLIASQEITSATLAPPSLATLPDVSARSVSTKRDSIQASDFTARKGDAKSDAITRTGGDANTEAAVEAALKYLASKQSPDGSWDPISTGADKERSPLNIQRPGAGSKIESALTGLSLLAFIGAGNTHREGPYAENVYRGLAYLIRIQKPNGSLAGDATIYASTYCHGMAALALCESAAITRDPSAIDAAKRAVDYTVSLQHPSTGGWRYMRGDPGDLSQLGWQAMVIAAAHSAGIPIERKTTEGIERFLKTVSSGRSGGLASYRAGEIPSRSMTAEALATKLLIGIPVTQPELSEAQRYLLDELPGSSVDNYYYWYYATIALHQVQDESWTRWNDALKKRLLATQLPDGDWSSNTLWGGYGGTIYTTAMATLCLESYYRHVAGDETKVARQPVTRR